MSAYDEDPNEKMMERKKQQEEIVSKYDKKTVEIYQKILKAEKGHVRASDLKKKVDDIIMGEVKG